MVRCARPALKLHPCLNIISGSHLSPQPEWREERRAIDSRHTVLPLVHPHPAFSPPVISRLKIMKHISEIKGVIHTAETVVTFSP